MIQSLGCPALGGQIFPRLLVKQRASSWMWVALFRCVLIGAVLGLADLGPGRAAAEVPAPKTVSGLPVPRFVSLKADRVNVRAGPTKDHDVTWVYNRAGLPVEITAEFENWRRIRDWEGAEGWVYHSLLSGRRTATVAAKGKKDELLALYDKPNAEGAILARLQAGVLASVKRCTGNWCRLHGEGFDGWIRQERLWGVYPNERLE